VRLANTPLKGGESARNNHVLACNFANFVDGQSWLARVFGVDRRPADVVDWRLGDECEAALSGHQRRARDIQANSATYPPWPSTTRS